LIEIAMANQGCTLFNTQQFTAFIAQLNAIQPVAGVNLQPQIQAMIDDAMNPILGVQAAVTSQIALLEPLTSPPTDIDSVISWITGVIDMSFVTPVSNMTNQLTVISAQLALLTAAITSLETRLGISITIPVAPHC
jgi:hypothetical protein